MPFWLISGSIASGDGTPPRGSVRVGSDRRRSVASSIHLLSCLVICDLVMGPFEEPVLPGASGQRVGAAVVVDGHSKDELVRAVEAAAVLDVADPSAVTVGRPPLGQDRRQGQV